MFTLLEPSNCLGENLEKRNLMSFYINCWTTELFFFPSQKKRYICSFYKLNYIFVYFSCL